jgi:hypothetical protein
MKLALRATLKLMRTRLVATPGLLITQGLANN